MDFFRKIVLWLFSIAMLMASGLSNNLPEHSLCMHGEVKSIDITQYGNTSVSLTVELNLKILNNGNEPIIFLTATPPIFPGVDVVKSESDLISGKFLIREYYGPSADTSDKWKNLREILRNNSPPSELTKVLMPNDSWIFNTSISIGIPTEAGRNSFYPKREVWESR